MNRKFLTDLGLTDEQADKVMAEHGKGVQELSDVKGQLATAEQERDSAKTQLGERDTQLSELKGQVGDNKELQDKITELESANEASKSDAASALADSKKSYEIKLALVEQGARNTTAVSALIDEDKISLDDNGKLVGLSDQLTTVKEANSFLFTDGPDTGNSTKPGNPNPPADPTENDKVAEALGLATEK